MFGNKQDKIAKAIEKRKIGELIKFTQDKDIEVAAAALTGLGKIVDDDSFNALVPFLSSPEATLRQAAACAMGEEGNGHGKAFLLHAISIEKDPSVKAAMEKACGQLKDY